MNATEQTPAFEQTYCSQCGGSFGPGDHGYSHCADHRREHGEMPAKTRSDIVSQVIGSLASSNQEWLADLLVPVRDDLIELDRMVPDLDGVISQNPVSQVYFRAGLLACREYMARFVEQGGDGVTAASIRANWWPSLGDDPGAPRQLRFEECASEREDGKVDVADTPVSIEALARAYVFLATTGAA